MSHVTEVKLRVRDLDALDEACEALGLELRRDRRTFAWWGTFVGDSRSYGEMLPKDMGKCEHAIRIKGDQPKDGPQGPWEIAVLPAKDGDGFKLFYDNFGAAGRRLTDAVGPDVCKLRQEYATAVSSAKAKRTLGPKGFRITRENLATGQVRLRVRR